MNRFFLSLMAGVAIGVLLAPDKGSETVKKLRNRLKDLKDDAACKGDELAGKAKLAFNGSRSAVNDNVE
jgi:gas vesicle protein